jgi:predicted Zn-dependent peptidase
MVVPRPSVPRVEFRLSLPAGAAMGPSAAVSELLAMGIPLGTVELDQSQLSERIQDLGGSLQVHQDNDRLYLQAAALSEAEEELYQLLAGLVAAPAFPAADLATERAKLIEGLRMARAEPHFPASENLQRLIYGDHPYGRSEPSETAVRRAGRQALRDFHRQTFSPYGAQITVVGDVEARRTQARLRRAFASWQGPRRVPRLPAVRAARSDEVLFIDRPGSVQTVILTGSSVPAMGHPDHMALALATAVLGGGFTSRLMNNLREDKGYSYSPHAGLDNHLLDGLATASMEVRTEVTAAAYVELNYEMGRLATVEVPPDELETTRRYLSGARVIFLQTQAGLASSLAQVRSHGLDHRYLEGYAQRLAAISPAELLRVASGYLAPAALTTVMVGEAGQVLKSLQRVAAVRVVAQRRTRGT